MMCGTEFCLSVCLSACLSVYVYLSECVRMWALGYLFLGTLCAYYPGFNSRLPRRSMIPTSRFSKLEKTKSNYVYMWRNLPKQTL